MAEQTHPTRTPTIVLVSPSHPGNIGAVARAMKTMDIQNLVLVNPKHFPHEEATARAAGAEDILNNAMIVTSLEEAVSHAHVVIGTSSRERNVQLPMLTPREFTQELSPNAGEVAIVFGCERTGLTNEDLMRCHQQLIIPTSTAYQSLNLASAVQIVCYELFLSQHSLNSKPLKGGKQPASHGVMEGLYAHLDSVMWESGFLKPGEPKKLGPKLRRLFNRSGLSQEEVNILRGILSAVQQTYAPILKEEEK